MCIRDRSNSKSPFDKAFSPERSRRVRANGGINQHFLIELSIFRDNTRFSVGRASARHVWLKPDLRDTEALYSFMEKLNRLKSLRLPHNYFQTHFDSRFPHSDAYRTASPTSA